MMILLPSFQILVEPREEVPRYNSYFGHYKTHPQVYSHVKKPNVSMCNNVTTYYHHIQPPSSMMHVTSLQVTTCKISNILTLIQSLIKWPNVFFTNFKMRNEFTYFQLYMQNIIAIQPIILGAHGSNTSIMATLRKHTNDPNGYNALPWPLV